MKWRITRTDEWYIMLANRYHTQFGRSCQFLWSGFNSHGGYTDQNLSLPKHDPVDSRWNSSCRAIYSTKQASPVVSLANSVPRIVNRIELGTLKFERASQPRPATLLSCSYLMGHIRMIMEPYTTTKADIKLTS